MSRLITWFDVETAILQKKYAGEWPESIVGISIYHDEIEVRVKNQDDIDHISKILGEWFGPRYQDKKILLESPSEGTIRFLGLSFEVEPDEEQFVSPIMKPDFAYTSVYSEKTNLEGPDFSKLEDGPSIWAFYSFKGGVSRTVHLVSMVKALTEKHPEKTVLIVDADLEAPGLTWWAEEQYGKSDISFLDFLALAHYDQTEDYAETLALTCERINGQRLVFKTEKGKGEHFFLPAFREKDQFLRMPLRPEHVSWEKGKEWIIPELLWKLGKELGVHAVIVDLRAGVSEISGPLLLDPRVNRIVISTPSSQSVEGTRLVLEECKKIADILERNHPESGYQMPNLILSMVKEDLKGTEIIESIKEKFIEIILPPSDDDTGALLGKDIIESLFDEKLLVLKNLDDAVEKLARTNMYEVMSDLVDKYFPAPNENPVPTPNEISVPDENSVPTPNEIFAVIDEPPPDVHAIVQSPATVQSPVEILRDTATAYVFAESGEAKNFLETQALRNLARKFQNSIPVAVVMGAKGSGKTYTYLQLVRQNKWTDFIKNFDPSVNTDHGIICPLISASNLKETARDIRKKSREYAGKELGINLSFPSDKDIEQLIDNQKKNGAEDRSSWRDFWIKIMASVLGCENEENPLAAMQNILAEKKKRLVFLIDGLEDQFQYISSNKVEQTAIQALCQSVISSLQEWPDNRIGLLVFIRKDIVKVSIKQNFGQFESLYQAFELKWNRTEVLRLVMWIVYVAGKSNDIYILPEGTLKLSSLRELMSTGGLNPLEIILRRVVTVPGSIETQLESLWGLKMGPLDSQETDTADWVIANLSDFDGQLQARDIVRFLQAAADKAMSAKDINEYPPRLLPPSAIREALKFCSEKKVEEIGQEVVGLKEIFEKLKNLDSEKRQTPFDKETVGLTDDEIEAMEQLGVITKYEGEYYLPEIFRHGLNFTPKRGARPKVLTLLRRALRK